MRFVPLIPSSFDVAPWRFLTPSAVRWEGSLHGSWLPAIQQGWEVHVAHLRGESPVEDGLEVMRLGVGVDFLVIPVSKPDSREAGFRLLGRLEALLEAVSGRGVKLALKLEAGAETPVLDLLRQARGEAVGFCWHPGTQDAEALADRLWCGVCEPDSDLAPLQRLGYRWDMALVASDPEVFRAQAEALAAVHPPVLFPAAPGTLLGRPPAPHEGVVFGSIWNRPGDRP